MALPPFTIASRADLETLIGIGAAADPREIDVINVESIRAAPEYLAAIQAKQARGWTCGRLPALNNFSRFSVRLTTLADGVLPRLQNHPNDRQALRKLRAQGKGIYELRRQAHQQVLLVHLAGHFANSLERSARQALSTDTDYEIPQDRVGHFLTCVNSCLNTAIKFPEVAPLPLPEGNVNNSGGEAKQADKRGEAKHKQADKRGEAKHKQADKRGEAKRAGHEDASAEGDPK